MTSYREKGKFTGEQNQRQLERDNYEEADTAKQLNTGMSLIFINPITALINSLSNQINTTAREVPTSSSRLCYISKNAAASCDGKSHRVSIKVLIWFAHIGTPQCVEPFDSRNGHSVSNDSDSMNT